MGTPHITGEDYAAKIVLRIVLLADGAERNRLGDSSGTRAGDVCSTACEGRCHGRGIMLAESRLAALLGWADRGSTAGQADLLLGLFRRPARRLLTKRCEEQAVRLQ